MPDSQSSEPEFESCFATVSKIGHFRSLHWRPCWLSCINEYLAIDSGGYVSDLVVARNCCMTRMLPGEAELVSGWTGLPGRAKSVKRLSGQTDWILRYIKTTFTFTPMWSKRYCSSFETASLEYESGTLTHSANAYLNTFKHIQKNTDNRNEDNIVPK